MDIIRTGLVAPDNGLPHIARAVIHQGIVYLCGVTPDPGGSFEIQTNQVLERIDRLLEGAGTDKARLLTAQVWLADMTHFASLNRIWNEWVPNGSPPVRACVRADLWTPGMLVEIMVTAALPKSAS